MPSTPSPSAPEAIQLEDVVQGIMRLPLAALQRRELLQKLLGATEPENLKNGVCVLKGPLREELHQLFTQRHGDVRAEYLRVQNLQVKAQEQAGQLETFGILPSEEEDLERIVEETSGDFEKLNIELDLYEKRLRADMESEFHKTSDQEGIDAARDILNAKQLPEAPPA